MSKKTYSVNSIPVGSAICKELCQSFKITAVRKLLKLSSSSFFFFIPYRPRLWAETKQCATWSHLADGNCRHSKKVASYARRESLPLFQIFFRLNSVRVWVNRVFCEQTKHARTRTFIMPFNQLLIDFDFALTTDGKDQSRTN